MATKAEMLIFLLLFVAAVGLMIKFSAEFIRFNDAWKAMPENSGRMGATFFDLFGYLSNEAKLYQAKVLRTFSHFGGLLLLMVALAGLFSLLGRII